MVIRTSVVKSAQGTQFGRAFSGSKRMAALEFLHQFNNNTWGFGQNAFGDVFGSTANNNPTFYGYLPATILNPTQPNAGRRGFRDGPPGAGSDGTNAQIRRISSARAMGPGMRMHPNTPNVRMVDQFGGYTAAAGHAFMVSDAMPARLQGKALVTSRLPSSLASWILSVMAAATKPTMVSISSPARRVDVADLRRYRSGRCHLGD